MSTALRRHPPHTLVGLELCESLLYEGVLYCDIPRLWGVCDIGGIIVRSKAWLVLGMLGSLLAGCGTAPVTVSKPAVSHSPHHTVPSKPSALPHAPVAAAPPTFSPAMAQTCIPSSDHYVTLTVASPQPTLQVQMGHPLTTQGAGIPETVVSFTGHAGQVAVTVPTNVVFSLGPTGALFGSVVDTHGALWLLFYVAVGPRIVPVLKGPALSVNRVVTWPLGGYTRHAPVIQRALAAARHAGWTTLTDVVARRHLTGIGVDGWLRLPLHMPLDIFNPTAGGTVVFGVSGVSTHVPPEYAAMIQNRCPTSAN